MVIKRYFVLPRIEKFQLEAQLQEKFRTDRAEKRGVYITQDS